MKTEVLTVHSHTREEIIDISSQIQAMVEKLNIRDGLLAVFVPHTTAALTINENADPDVKRDILNKLRSEIPQTDDYYHSEGNSDAHIKSSLLGHSLIVIVENGQLLLGTWQGILFCEFDGPRNRKVFVKPLMA